MWTLLLEHFFLQLAFTVGIVILMGLTVSGVKRIFLLCWGRGARAMEIVTGLVGTPVHELSHAFFCILFGHRITAIRLWSPHAEGGDLGFVTHTYKKRNLWHQIGNFFIGIAPIIGGSAVLLLLLFCLLPDSARAIFGAIPEHITADPALLPAAMWGQVRAVLGALFQIRYFLYWHWYLYLLLAALIVLHMEISASDLRSGVWGLLFLAVLLLSMDVILFLWRPDILPVVTSYAVRLGACLLTFFCLAAVLSVILLVVSLLALILRRRA